MPAIDSAIDWAGTYSVESWRLMRVKPASWEDAEEIPGVTSASVKLDAGGRLLLSGSIDLDADEPWQEAEAWGRLEVLVSQGGVAERHDVATMLLVPKPSAVRLGRAKMSLEGQSPLQPAEDELLLAGTTAPMGADGAAWAAHMLSCCFCPVNVAGSFRMAEHTVFEAGTSRAEAARRVLDAAGWCVQLAGDGSATIRPLPTEPAVTIDGAGARMIGTEVKADFGRAGVPNRYVATLDGMTATATDEDPASATSHATRGRWVDKYDSNPDLASGEDVHAYARRRLAEETGAAGSRSFPGAWLPGITTSDVVRGALPAAALEGDMRVTGLQLRLGAGLSATWDLEVMA